jgi:hypothetical protein
MVREATELVPVGATDDRVFTSVINAFSPTTPPDTAAAPVVGGGATTPVRLRSDDDAKDPTGGTDDIEVGERRGAPVVDDIDVDIDGGDEGEVAANAAAAARPLPDGIRPPLARGDGGRLAAIIGVMEYYE